MSPFQGPGTQGAETPGGRGRARRARRPRDAEALLDIGYSHHVGLEYEKDMADPIPGAAESFGYIRGTLACMGHHRG